MAIYPLEFYRRAEEKWRRCSESVRAAVTGSPSKKEGDDTLVRWPWLLAIGQGLPVRIRCIKKTTPPETSCGTAEEAYKVPPSLTVAVRDQQLRLDPSRRPRPEQHSPRIPLVPRALLRALETELLTSAPHFTCSDAM